MKCPKCSSNIVPYSNAPDSDKHCLICGFLILGYLPVVMPEIPKLTRVYSTHPSAVYDRERRARLAEHLANRTYPDQRRRFSNPERAYIITEHARGVSYQEMALTLGRSNGSISSFVNRYITQADTHRAQLAAMWVAGEQQEVNNV